ncbi:hypothetical protein EGR_02700 [Echinococcus granulosus]|uniref:Uncharacterized protein n=1 Tax=Echinococcus granulosus TaxID=6210 RepID=W6UN68_ECHGR|nr:hypothetical protein EGR_02700 [Echinococcus granulosus]EUB62568.1 hypothetical protein EGR_02700 [Echinococcus granulosus]
MYKPTASLFFFFTLCGTASFGESHGSDYNPGSKLNLTDVDVIIYIGYRIPSHGPQLLAGLIEDLNEVHSIFAPTGELSSKTDGTLDVYNSATKAATLAYLGAFRDRESILIVVGSDVVDNLTPWRAKNMIELNIALGFLYPLYQPQNRIQRYEQFALFNASREVAKFSESIESGRRIARHISSRQNGGWNHESLLSLLQSTFQDNVIHVDILNASSEGYSSGSFSGGKVIHLKFKPDSAGSTVFLISSNAIDRGVATIVGFFEIVRQLQPKETEFQAIIGCFNDSRNFLSGLNGNPMNEVLGVPIPSRNADVYVIGADNRDLKKKVKCRFCLTVLYLAPDMAYDYYGQKLDYEFGPLMADNDVDTFVRKSVGDKGSKMVFFLEQDSGSSVNPLYSTPIAGLVTRYLLKPARQKNYLYQDVLQ